MMMDGVAQSYWARVFYSFIFLSTIIYPHNPEHLRALMVESGHALQVCAAVTQLYWTL